MPSFFPRSSPLLAACYSWWHGTRIRCRGPGHQIQRHNAVLRGTKIEILGTGCRLTIGPGARLWDCSITLAGEGAELSIGAGCRLQQTRLCVEDRGSRLLIGSQTSIIGGTLVSQEGRLLSVGADCMFALRADVRNSDGHAIYDQQAMRINAAEDVVVGNHVWLGLGACVGTGARIGDGAVIGALALVTAEIPPACVAFGVPARPRRTGIRWDRSRATPGPPATTDLLP